jgi:glycosyltransferase involved in cell wall biosynthesis
MSEEGTPGRNGDTARGKPEARARTWPGSDVAPQLPYVTIIIPVYNEEGLMETAIRSLREQLAESFEWPYELIIAENGSTDATVPIARKLSEKYPEVRTISLSEPNYGRALKRAILESRGTFVFCDEIDLCDITFYQGALEKLELGYDLVIGSKLLAGAEDTRPMFRHMASMVLNGLLRTLVGFKGTDTHGLKAFHRDHMLDVVADCRIDQDMFASELVIRAERSKVRISEIPLRVVEKRNPSVNLLRRIPHVLKSLARLTISIRFGG